MFNVISIMYIAFILNTKTGHKRHACVYHYTSKNFPKKIVAKIIQIHSDRLLLLIKTCLHNNVPTCSGNFLRRTMQLHSQTSRQTYILYIGPKHENYSLKILQLDIYFSNYIISEYSFHIDMFLRLLHKLKKFRAQIQIGLQYRYVQRQL